MRAVPVLTFRLKTELDLKKISSLLPSATLHRLCSDGEAVHLYYTTENSRVYHKEEPKSMEIDAEV